MVDGADGWGLIKKFKADSGELVWQRGDAAPLELRYPHGVAVDREGRIYVSDAHKGALQQCSADTGDLLGWYGGCYDPSHAGSGHWHETDSSHAPCLGHGPAHFNLHLM